MRSDSTPVRGWLTLALMGAIAAALVASPVDARSGLNRKKVRKIATRVFERRIGPATAALQPRCADGAVLAHAFVASSPSFPNTYTSDPGLVQNAFNCRSAIDEVQVRRFGTGMYAVSIPGLTDAPGNSASYVVVTGPRGSCLVDCTDAAVNWTPGSLADVPVIFFSVQDFQPTADGADSGSQVDVPFSFAVLDSS